jgi:hypothetical protein
MRHWASYTVGQVMGTLKRVFCSLRGHEEYLHFDNNRVYLQCVVCGHESPGWTVESRRPVLRFPARAAAKPGALIRRIA